MTHKFQHEFKGFGRVPSCCEVKIFSDDGEHLICFTDIGIGTSVTSATEQLVSEIVNNMELHPKDCRFFETYRTTDTIEEITHQWCQDKNFKWIAENPDWTLCHEEEINILFKQL